MGTSPSCQPARLEASGSPAPAPEGKNGAWKRRYHSHMAFQTSYPIIPASGSIYWVIAPVLVVLLVVGGLMASVAYGARRVTFNLSSEGLRIQGDLYGRRIPAAELELGQARAVDLSRDRDLALTWKKNGAGLPGYKSGWFGTRNGGKALVFLTDQSHVAYIPTTKDYILLLSVAEPERFIRDARAAMGK